MGDIRKIWILVFFLFQSLQLWGQWPRYFWEQIEKAEGQGFFAITDINGNGEWTDTVKLIHGPDGPIMVIGGDTVVTGGNSKGVLCDTITHPVNQEGISELVLSGLSENGYLVGRYEDECGLSGFNIKTASGSGAVPVSLLLNGEEVGSNGDATTEGAFVSGGWLLRENDLLTFNKGGPTGGDAYGLFVTIEIVCKCGVFVRVGEAPYEVLSKTGDIVLMDANGRVLAIFKQ